MSRVFTGSKAIIRIDNTPLIFVSAITVTHENRLEEIPQLDSLEVGEYAENGHRCSFTVNVFKVITETAETLGLDPINPKDILTLPELLVEVLDDSDPEKLPVYVMEGVKFEGGTGAINARGVWEGVWNFKARRGRGI